MFCVPAVVGGKTAQKAKSCLSIAKRELGTSVAIGLLNGGGLLQKNYTGAITAGMVGLTGLTSAIGMAANPGVFTNYYMNYNRQMVAFLGLGLGLMFLTSLVCLGCYAISRRRQKPEPQIIYVKKKHHH